MGLDYSPKNNIKPHCGSQYDDGGFAFNSAGSSLMGQVYLELGIPMAEGNPPLPLSQRIPYVADDAEARAAEKILAEATDDQIKAVLDVEGMRSMFSGTPDDFVEWVRDWQRFLEVCGGYDTGLI